MRTLKHGIAVVAFTVALALIGAPPPGQMTDVGLGFAVAVTAFIAFVAGYISRDSER